MAAVQVQAINPPTTPKNGASRFPLADIGHVEVQVIQIMDETAAVTITLDTDA